MSMETYGVIQVKEGKFHRPAETTHERMKWFSPMMTVCGATVRPLNVFPSESDAMEYTGGRSQFLCRRCFRAGKEVK